MIWKMQLSVCNLQWDSAVFNVCRMTLDCEFLYKSRGRLSGQHQSLHILPPLGLYPHHLDTYKTGVNFVHGF